MNRRGMATFVVVAMIALGATYAFATGAEETQPVQQEPSGPVTVTFWHYWDGTNGQVLQSLIDEYESDHPNVTIQAEFVPGSDLGTKLQAAIVARETPTMAIVDLITMPMLTKSGALAPLDEMIAASSVDMSDYFAGPLVYGERNGHRYSLPVSASNLGLFWNKELFQRAGLNPDVPPRTWEELVTMAQQIKDRTGAWGYELFTEGGEGTSWQWQVFLWQSGGDILNADLNRAIFDSPAGVKALDFWASLINDYEVSTIASWGLFGRGEAAMVMDGSWMTQFFPMQVDFELGSALFPYPSDGTPATNMGGEQVFVFAGDDAQEEAAWKFIEWFSSTAVQVEWCKGTGFMPIKRSVAESTDYVSWVEQERPLLLPFVQSMEYAKPRPPVETYSQLSDALAEQVVSALYQRMEPEEALSTAANEVDAILR